MFLSTDHEMAQRNGDHFMEIVRVIPERHHLVFSEATTLRRKK